MTYFLVRVQTPDQQTQDLFFVLDRNQNLVDQVIARIGQDHVILSINVLGTDWA